MDNNIEQRLSQVFFDKPKTPVYYCIKWGDKVFKNTNKSGKWTYRSPRTAHNALVERLFYSQPYGHSHLDYTETIKFVDQLEANGVITYERISI